MNTSSSFAKKPMEGKVKSEEKCKNLPSIPGDSEACDLALHLVTVSQFWKAFMDICKYFSKEQWAKLGNSEKITHVYMKRNYDTMTQLGLRAHLPDFMRPKKQTTKSPEQSPEQSSDEDQNPRNQDVDNRRSGRLMGLWEGDILSDNFINQHISTMGSGKGKTNVWLHRLRERKNPVVYEEISDPEEDDCGCDKCA